MFTLGELADRLDLRFTGDAHTQISGLASLATAGPDQLSFLADGRYLSALAATSAAAVILSPDHAGRCPAACLLAEDPISPSRGHRNCSIFHRTRQVFIPRRWWTRAPGWARGSR